MSVKPMTQAEMTAALKGDDGQYAAGGGLFLTVRNGRGYWSHRYWKSDKSHPRGGVAATYGLGTAEEYPTPPKARAKQGDVKWELRNERRAKLNGTTAPLALPAPTPEPVVPPFGEAATKYLKDNDTDYSTAVRANNGTVMRKHIPAWFHALPVASITSRQIANVLLGRDQDGEPVKGRASIWNGLAASGNGTKTRSLIERVLRSQKVRPNPAEWNELEGLLPKKRIKAEKNHAEAGMPVAEVPAFFAGLGDGAEDRGGRLVILTGLRRCEVLEAKWGEFNIPNRTWLIPRSRMKNKSEKRGPHKVTLTDAMIEALGTPGASDAWVFTGAKGGCLGNSGEALDKHWFERKGAKGRYVLHGFRATMKAWAVKRYPLHVFEIAQDHAFDLTDVAKAYSGLVNFDDETAKMWADWSQFVTVYSQAGENHFFSTRNGLANPVETERDTH
jgi:integrase